MYYIFLYIYILVQTMACSMPILPLHSLQDEEYAYQLQLEELDVINTDIQDQTREWKLALQAESVSNSE